MASGLRLRIWRVFVVSFDPYCIHTAQGFHYTPDTLHAIDPTSPPSPRSARLAGVACITFALVLHGTALKAGLRLQNALGMFKLFVLLGIALSGLAVLAGVPGFHIDSVSLPPSGSSPDMWTLTASFPFYPRPTSPQTT